MKYLFLTVLISLIVSCTGKSGQPMENVVARVGNTYLNTSDITGIVPQGTSTKDSISIIRDYVNSWIKKMIVLNIARSSISNSNINIDKQVEDYRNSLIIYEYQKELVKQKLDTVVTDAEILEYYNKNNENFILKDNIIQVLFVKLPKNAPNITKAKNLCFSGKQEDKKTLLDYCRQYASNYYLEDDSWLLFSDLLKEIPIKTYDQESFLMNNRTVEINDSLFQYFVNIKGFKTRETPSPLSFEYDNIKNIIINKRKITLINEMEKKVYEEALEKNEFEIFQ